MRLNRPTPRATTLRQIGRVSTVEHASRDNILRAINSLSVRHVMASQRVNKGSRDHVQGRHTVRIMNLKSVSKTSFGNTLVQFTILRHSTHQERIRGTNIRRRPILTANSVRRNKYRRSKMALIRGTSSNSRLNILTKNISTRHYRRLSRSIVICLIMIVTRTRVAHTSASRLNRSGRQANRALFALNGLARDPDLAPFSYTAPWTGYHSSTGLYAFDPRAIEYRHSR